MTEKVDCTFKTDPFLRHEVLFDIFWELCGNNKIFESPFLKNQQHSAHLEFSEC